MSVYRVRVRCTHEAVKEHRRRNNICYQECLVEAEEGSLAMEAGAKFVEDNAPSDVRWLEFMPLSAAKVKLPMLFG